MRLLYRATVVARLLAFSAIGTVAIEGCKAKPGGADAEAVATPASSAAVPVPAFHGFEGELDFVVKDEKHAGGGGGESIPVFLVIKGNKVRAEIPKTVGAKSMPKGHLVLDTPEKKLYLVMDEEKQVVVVDLNKTTEELRAMVAGLPKTEKSARSESPSKPPPKVTKTSMVDKVADVPCQIWEISNDSQKVATLCIAEQPAPWFQLPVQGMPAEYAWAQELMDGRHVPLRMIAYDKNGAEDGRAELTKLDTKPLADVLFQLPADYKIVDAAAMMGRLGGFSRMPQAGPPPAVQPAKKHK